MRVRGTVYAMRSNYGVQLMSVRLMWTVIGMVMILLVICPSLTQPDRSKRQFAT
jgi:hypothetical protein